MTDLLFVAGRAVPVFTEAEKATIEILPFLGLGVVIAGLTILALVLTQFKRIGGGEGHGHGHGHGKKTAPKMTDAPKAEAARQTPVEAEEGELAAIAAAIGLYLEESAEVVNLTEVERQFNQSPWTAFGIQRQQYRFQQWQSSR